ncbi:MAG: hypothetical protein QUS13_01760, partial [Smithella sp.]|nr:hypothetical protein [Smithella sp.]
SMVNPTITTTGPGTVEQLVSDNSDEYQYKMTTEGTYYFTAQANGPDGNIYQDTKAVTVLPLAQIDALLRAKWAALKDALQRGDINTAIMMMHPSSREKYQNIFNLVKDNLATIMVNCTGLEFVSMDNEIAIYELQSLEYGEVYIYRLAFIKDENGIWFIREF